MPKRISDVSLHVYVTPETLERVVDTVRAVVDEHLAERDVFAWRFTLPVDSDDPAHAELQSRCPTDPPTLLRTARPTRSRSVWSAHPTSSPTSTWPHSNASCCGPSQRWREPSRDPGSRSRSAHRNALTSISTSIAT